MTRLGSSRVMSLDELRHRLHDRMRILTDRLSFIPKEQHTEELGKNIRSELRIVKIRLSKIDALQKGTE